MNEKIKIKIDRHILYSIKLYPLSDSRDIKKFIYLPSISIIINLVKLEYNYYEQ
jgi:hypothetical protein